MKNKTAIENDLNSKILKITMTISNHYPELSKYIEEMPITIPNESNPKISITKLNSYYDSLSTILLNYILEQPLVHTT